MPVDQVVDGSSPSPCRLKDVLVADHNIKMKQIKELIDTGIYEVFKPDKPMLIKDLLDELNLEGKYFGILVNGKKANSKTKITPNDEIVILPNIAGGMEDNYLSRLDDMDVEDEEITRSKTRLSIWLDEEYTLQPHHIIKNIKKVGKDLPLNL